MQKLSFEYAIALLIHQDLLKLFDSFRKFNTEPFTPYREKIVESLDKSTQKLCDLDLHQTCNHENVDSVITQLNEYILEYYLNATMEVDPELILGYNTWKLTTEKFYNKMKAIHERGKYNYYKFPVIAPSIEEFIVLNRGYLVSCDPK